MKAHPSPVTSIFLYNRNNDTNEIPNKTIFYNLTIVDAAVGPGPLGELDARHLWKRAASVSQEYTNEIESPPPPWPMLCVPQIFFLQII